MDKKKKEDAKQLKKIKTKENEYEEINKHDNSKKIKIKKKHKIKEGNVKKKYCNKTENNNTPTSALATWRAWV